jgi:hypothetical protein
MGRSQVNLNRLVIEISEGLEMEEGGIRRVVEKLWRVIAEALNKRESVAIRRFGTFRVEDDEDGIPRVTFHPSHLFKMDLNVRSDMNKYSVVLDQNKIAAAKLTGNCPDCGQKLESLSPPKCPKCGTKPFEDRPSLEEGHGD